MEVKQETGRLTKKSVAGEIEKALNQDSGSVSNGETGSIIEESKGRTSQMGPFYLRR